TLDQSVKRAVAGCAIYAGTSCGCAGILDQFDIKPKVGMDFKRWKQPGSISQTSRRWDGLQALEWSGTNQSSDNWSSRRWHEGGWAGSNHFVNSSRQTINH